MKTDFCSLIPGGSQDIRMTSSYIPAALKKVILARQKYCCAADVDGYDCPNRGRTFDESGFTWTFKGQEPQALCKMCHGVKFSQDAAARAGKLRITTAAPLHVIEDSDLDSDEMHMHVDYFYRQPDGRFAIESS